MSSTMLLTVIWALSLLYGEWFAYLVPSLWGCSWPRPYSPNGVVDYSSSYVKIAVITDPQLMDRTSHRGPPKSFALKAAQFYTDLYMRRAFLLSVLPFNPDVLLFLGDYFDGGPWLHNEEWQESLHRFRHVFNLHMIENTSNIKVFYLSGNHDVGYEAINTKYPMMVKRYEGEFGPSNFKITLGLVDFIAIDAQTVDGHPQGNLTSATWEFIRRASQDASDNPRVLLTHIPLYRPDWTPCGPHRSYPIINQRIRRSDRDQKIEYQNYVTENSTNDLLDLINPELVLSGHDHDQCTVVHMSKHGPVTEDGACPVNQQRIVEIFQQDLKNKGAVTISFNRKHCGSICTPSVLLYFLVSLFLFYSLFKEKYFNNKWWTNKKKRVI